MTDKLLSTAESAALCGITSDAFLKAARKLGVNPAKLVRIAKFWRAQDVERVRTKRKRPGRPWPKKRKRKGCRR